MDKDEKEEDAKVLIDPNTWSESGTTSISLLQASGDHRYIAFLIQEAGSDWGEFWVLVMKHRQGSWVPLKWLRYGGAAWTGHDFPSTGFRRPGWGVGRGEHMI